MSRVFFLWLLPYLSHFFQYGCQQSLFPFWKLLCPSFLWYIIHSLSYLKHNTTLVSDVLLYTSADSLATLSSLVAGHNYPNSTSGREETFRKYIPLNHRPKALEGCTEQISRIQPELVIMRQVYYTECIAWMSLLRFLLQLCPALHYQPLAVNVCQ